MKTYILKRTIILTYYAVNMHIGGVLHFKKVLTLPGVVHLLYPHDMTKNRSILLDIDFDETTIFSSFL